MAEIKKYIEFVDIIAVRIQCKKCLVIWEGSIDVLRKYFATRGSTDCPAGCGNSWDDQDALRAEGKHTIAAKDFVNYLAKLRDSLPKQNYSLALRIEDNSLRSKIAATEEEIAELEQQVAREKR